MRYRLLITVPCADKPIQKFAPTIEVLYKVLGECLVGKPIGTQYTLSEITETAIGSGAVETHSIARTALAWEHAAAGE